VASIGILGGTFNPPHVGHVAVAVYAREQLGLERVLLMPAAIPPHKGPGQDPGAEHRLRMCELAVADVAGVEACGLELDRGGMSYTVDTLQSIHESHPQAQLTFVVGADTASTLASWREPARLLDLARLAVATRTGTDREAVRATVASILGERAADGRLDYLEMGPVEVSSSLVRTRAAEHAPLEDLVGVAVAGYIEQQGLYANAGARAVSA
jgi:nicotinate-nucleotide adenylyltransferase